MKYDVEKMFQMALAAREQAYAPYSNFQVGACIFSSEGGYYAGCNVENTSYPMGQCAEATAVGNMILHGSKKIMATLVMTDTDEGVLPCGGCLQKLSEFMDADADIIIANLQGIKHIKKLADLFNNQFAMLFSELHKA